MIAKSAIEDMKIKQWLEMENDSAKKDVAELADIEKIKDDFNFKIMIKIENDTKSSNAAIPKNFDMNKYSGNIISWRAFKTSSKISEMVKLRNT